MMELTGSSRDNLNELSFNGTLRPHELPQPLAAPHENGEKSGKWLLIKREAADYVRLPRGSNSRLQIWRREFLTDCVIINLLKEITQTGYRVIR